MPRTIRVREEIYGILEKMKRRMKARSFDEVIGRLLLKELGIPGDMFGVDRVRYLRLRGGIGWRIGDGGIRCLCVDRVFPWLWEGLRVCEMLGRGDMLRQ